jgi:hypothetical protein
MKAPTLEDRLASMNERAKKLAVPMLDRAYGGAIFLASLACVDGVGFTDEQLKEVWDLWSGNWMNALGGGFCAGRWTDGITPVSVRKARSEKILINRAQRHVPDDDVQAILG